MSSPFAAMIDAVARQRGVVGSMIVAERDGIIVDATLQLGVPGSAVAALAASLYRKARRSAGAAGFGEVTFLQLEAERGRICVAGRGELVLIAVAELRANVGLIRVAMLRAVGELA